MNLAIIKYAAGNIQSVLNALARLGVQGEVTDDAETIRSADKVLFPGVGEACTAMQSLRVAGLDAVIRDLRQPVFGICVGMQLLCDYSEESDTSCLGIIPVTVRRFAAVTAAGEKLKVPQVGWNRIHHLQSALFAGVEEESYIYNVHSFYAPLCAYTIARCDYGLSYSAALRKDNFWGVQFHTEKSADTGDRILQNFLNS